MEFILDIAEFLLQAIILLGVFLIAFAGVMALSQRKRGAGEEGTVEARSLNERFEMHEEAVRAVTEDPLESKARGKDQKKEKKAKRKAIKQALKAEDDGEARRPRVFVLDFDGDMQASQVDQLREEVSAILPVVGEADKVLLRLESGGGVVHGYGLAASQLTRLKNAGITLTISVDKVAASGGYMMACVGDEIIAAPFAILGSIGVVAQLPNFHRLLKRMTLISRCIPRGSTSELSRYSAKTRIRPEKSFRLISMTSTCYSRNSFQATDRLSPLTRLAPASFGLASGHWRKSSRIACVPRTAFWSSTLKAMT